LPTGAFFPFRNSFPSEMSLLLRRSLRGYDVDVPAFTLRRSARVAGVNVPALSIPTKFRASRRRLAQRKSRRLRFTASFAAIQRDEARAAFHNRIAEILVPYHGQPVATNRGARLAFFAACEFVMSSGAAIMAFPDMLLGASEKIFTAERMFRGRRFQRLAADWRAFLDDLDDFVRSGAYAIALSRKTL
jgi:hypothetical protein